MPDLETRLPELFRRAAAGGTPGVEFERRVLRRARRRRVVNASVTGLAAVVLLAGAFLGAQELALSDRTTPADESPSPSPSPSPGTVTIVLPLPGAVWPEVDLASLEAAQAEVDLASLQAAQGQADAGELVWRLDPVQTAAVFATEILGWDPADVRAEESARPRTGTALVEISNLGLGPGIAAAGPPAPVTTIELRQLGATGGGIWSVVGADSDLIAIDPLPRSVQPGETIEVSGSLSEVRIEWSGLLALLSVDPTDGAARIFPGELTEAMAGTVRVPSDAVANVAVVTRLYDPEGTTVAVDVVPIAVRPGASDAKPTGATGAPPTTAPVPTGPTNPGEQIPSAVLSTRDRIAVAAENHDVDALAQLMGPGFSYNFDVGSAAVQQWRDDPTPLDTLATILQMPFSTSEVEGLGTIYLWPSLMAADLTELTAEERQMLDSLGITDAQVQDMLAAFGGYAGPRTVITEDGTWHSFAMGGD